MAFPDNIARVDWRFTNAVGATCHVIQHTRLTTGDYTVGECQAVALHAKNSWDTVGYLGGSVAALKSQANVGVTLNDVTVTGLKAVGPPQHVEAVNIAGSQAGNALPPETALVIAFKTGTPGKSFRGRSYWPGLDPDQLEANGTLSAAALTAYQNQWTAYLNKLATISSSLPVIYSPTLATSTVITSAIVRDTPHHQRRRNS